MIPGNSCENPKASVAKAAKAPCDMMPWGWYPNMYLRVGERGAERWRRAGKYWANKDQMGRERKRFDLWESSPEVAALEKRT